MIDMRCAFAPAGVSAWGALVVRPAAGGAVLTARPRYAVVRTLTPFDLTGTATAAPTAPFQGTGLPAAGQFGIGTGVLGTDAPTTDISHTRHTLGIHSPGRPQS
ncbi:hypothetical protein GCM10027451_24950 [Geodermatophilus aquaeductus]|uniref:Uncharacterized protein n=1 Tax=Geodermatophilus aquaeductus TaxID=1564161 RepID=A0A521EMY1_9ACTN|nr:hypothetical protein [Geodermatophilus aquaeductus]SMO85254.1 hypothetical protein SAMN06273567_105323 [Geodermatophilus aquaeductus]